MGIDVIGTLYIDKFLCRLETQSMDLAEFAVSHFTGLFGEAVTFKRIIKLKIDRFPNQNENGEPEESEAQITPSPELISQVLEDYYLDLLDEKIPALNNMTPREARKDSEALPLLIDWLKELENLSGRKKRDGEYSISIEKIKKDLDIDW